MTTPFWVELVCDNCAKADIGEWAWNGQIRVRALKERARKAGWLFKGDRVFCSEHCCKKSKESEVS